LQFAFKSQGENCVQLDLRVTITADGRFCGTSWPRSRPSSKSWWLSCAAPVVRSIATLLSLMVDTGDHIGVPSFTLSNWA